MPISNCASCGADSFTNSITGAVSRKNEQTGQVEPASVRPVGVDNTQTEPSNTASEAVKPATNLSEAPTLAPKTQAATVQASTEFQQALATRQTVQAYNIESGEAPKAPPLNVDVSL